MNTKIVTLVVIVVGVTGLVAWDLVVNFNSVTGDTISELVGTGIRSAPILGVLLGVVVGHLASENPELIPMVKWIGSHPFVSVV